MRFSFVMSEDSSLLLKRAKEIQELFFSQKSLESARHTFWGDEGLSSDFWQMLTIVSLEPKADFFLIRKAEKLNADTWKKISETLATLREDAFLVFCIESDWEKKAPKIPAYISNQKCFTFSEKKNWNSRIPSLDMKSLPPYIQKGFRERGLTCHNSVIESLCSMLPPYASAVDNTLDQLALVTDTSEITNDDLSNLSSVGIDILLFDYIKYLENGNTFNLWKNILQDSGKAEDVFFGLIALLTREARILWQILFSDSVKLPSFLLSQKTQSAHRLGKKKVAYLFMLLREAEWSIKSGKKQVSQAMEELLADLNSLYRA